MRAFPVTRTKRSRWCSSAAEGTTDTASQFTLVNQSIQQNPWGHCLPKKTLYITCPSRFARSSLYFVAFSTQIDSKTLKQWSACIGNLSITEPIPSSVREHLWHKPVSSQMATSRAFLSSMTGFLTFLSPFFWFHAVFIGTCWKTLMFPDVSFLAVLWKIWFFHPFIVSSTDENREKARLATKHHQPMAAPSRCPRPWQSVTSPGRVLCT